MSGRDLLPGGHTELYNNQRLECTYYAIPVDVDRPSFSLSTIMME